MEIDWVQLGDYLLKIGVAFALTLPIAFEREVATGDIGLRTFPIVAVASCGYVLVALAVLGTDAQAQARIIQGLMTGIGFIGGGAILKQGDYVRGTATAASIWTTGAMGGAVAYGRYEIAIIISIINLLTLHLFKPLRHSLGGDGEEQK